MTRQKKEAGFLGLVLIAVVVGVWLGWATTPAQAEQPASRWLTVSTDIANGQLLRYHDAEFGIVCYVSPHYVGATGGLMKGVDALDCVKIGK